MATKTRHEIEPVLPRPVRRGIIAGCLVVVALAVFGLTRLPSNKDTSGAAPGILQSFSPAENDKIPQQGQIRVVLKTGWDGTLAIDQKQIPKSELLRNNDEKVASYQALIFQPGPGKTLEYFPAGQNCATVTYWALETGPSQSFTKSWCFTAF